MEAKATMTLLAVFNLNLDRRWRVGQCIDGQNVIALSWVAKRFPG